MELIEIKRGFWLRKGRSYWYLHWRFPHVTWVEAEGESDAVVKLTTKLRQMRDDADEGGFLHQLYGNAVTWLEDYRA